MKRALLTFSLSLGLMTAGLLIEPAWGQTSITHYLIEEGINHYNTGNYDQAIHQLSKALLADPSNPKAKFYLQKMGLSEGLYGTHLTPLDHVSQLSQDIQRMHLEVDQLELEKTDLKQEGRLLKDKNARFKEKIEQKDKEILDLYDDVGQLLKETESQETLNVALEEQALRKDVENDKLVGLIDHQNKMHHRQLTEREDQRDQLKGDLKFVKAKAIQKSLRDGEKIDHLQDQIFDQEGRLDNLGATLYRVKDKWAQNMLTLKDKDSQLLKAREEKILTEDRLWQKALDYEEILDHMDREVEGLKNQVIEGDFIYRDQLAALKEELHLSQDEMIDLKDTLLTKQLELSEMERLMNRQDTQILALKDRLASLRGPAQPADIKEKEDLEKLMIAKDATIADLKEELSEAAQKLQLMEKQAVLPEGISDMAFQNEIKALKEQLQEKDELLKEKDLSLRVLKGRLDAISDRLTDLEEAVQEKNLKIQDLEDRLQKLKEGNF